MGPVTAVFRTERLDFIYPYAPIPGGPVQNGVWRAFRQTAGSRVRIPGGLTAQFNVFRHSKWVSYDGQSTAFDFALTYSLRASSSKDRN